MQALKAACDEAIAVVVSRTGQTSAIWERLLAAVVVEPNIHDDPSTGRYDISYQLAEIEVKLCMPCQPCIALYVLTHLHCAALPAMFQCLACHAISPLQTCSTIFLCCAACLHCTASLHVPTSQQAGKQTCVAVIQHANINSVIAAVTTGNNGYGACAVQGRGLLRNPGIGPAAECPVESLWTQHLRWRQGLCTLFTICAGLCSGAHWQKAAQVRRKNYCSRHVAIPCYSFLRS